MERDAASIVELIKLGALVLGLHILINRLLPVFLNLLPKLM